MKLAKNSPIPLERYKMALDDAYDHIIITDPAGIIVYANKAVTQTTGYSQDEVIGKNPSVWGKQMEPEFYKKLWQIISVEKRPFVGEVTNRRKNGQIYQAEAKISPIINDHGEVLGYIGIERDITLLKEIDRAKTEFVSLASHQLRTPLTAINWHTELALTQVPENIAEELKVHLEFIHQSSQRMTRLVSALLNVSRLETGSFVVDSTPLDLKDVITNSLQDVLPTINEKKIKLKQELDDLPGRYLADENLLEIVLVNLLTNAVKYTPAGGDIDLKAELIHGEGLVIEVKDSGIGIQETDKSRIFEKMFRAQNAQQIDTEGNGLGLYMVKRIVEEVGGTIKFTSEADQGSTFTVLLPEVGMAKKSGTKKLSKSI